MAPRKQTNAIEALTKQRNRIKQNIERVREAVFESATQLTNDELECRLEIVEAYFTQALELQSNIEELDNPIENVNAASVREELENIYCDVKSRIKSMIKVASACDVKSRDQPVSSPMFENLPKLKLPTFSGKYSEFHNFIRLFKTLVNNNPRLSIIEKFNHLHACLSGSALRTVKALDFTEDNYDTALSLLETRFDNKYLMCQEHIKEMFNLTKVQKDSPEQLRFLIDTVTARFNALSSLLSYEEIANSLIINIITAVLDSDSQQKVEESIDCGKTLKWSDCAKILMQRCQILETRDYDRDQKKQRQVVTTKQFHKTHKPIALAANNNNCNCCDQPDVHPLWKCTKFLELSPIQRFEYIKQINLCINCFSSQHSVRHCKSSKCKYCNSNHHTLLHRGNTSSNLVIEEANTNQLNNSLRHLAVQQQQQHQPQQQHLSSQHQQYSLQANGWHTAPSFQPQSSTNINSSSSTNATVGQQKQSLHTSNVAESQTILATALLHVTDKYGKKQIARALLDSASQLNFISQNFAQSLNVNKFKASTPIGGIGQSQTVSKFATSVQIQSMKNNFSTTLECLILPTITGMQPHYKIDKENLNIPANLQFADPEFHIPQKIDLLIGAELFYDLLEGKHIKLGKNQPTLMLTTFGWIVAGKCTKNTKLVSLIANPVSSFEYLDELVNQFWSCEMVPDIKRKLSKEQTECELYFKNTTKRLDSGRFEVRLPFRAQPITLGDSKHLALKRFLNLEKRLNSKPDVKQAYRDFLHDYESQGHMTQIEWPSNLNGYYIMPHHSVLRPDKTTTKLRVVFDGSAKTNNNISLNDILMVGPVVQNELVEVLWRFRLHQYGLMADVTAMYRQIRVNKEDCKVQNIIWRNEQNDQLKLYRLNTVTYGTASAPYLATKCLAQLAEDNLRTNAKAATIIQNDFYVDDLITGGATIEELQIIKTDVTKILADAGLKLHKWFSNEQKFLSELSIDEREKTFDFNNSPVVKALGIIWDADNDAFKFKHSALVTDSTTVTKRRVLSELSQLFDPLGLIKPVIVKSKIFLQELWLKNYGWDEIISDEHAAAWNSFLAQLNNIQEIIIPRYVLLPNANIQLHGFTDASTRAYGCCFYIRCTDSLGNMKISLFTSRSKVAPIRIVRSLPCLELCGAHLMTQLLEKIRHVTKFDAIFLWTDSTIVLQWLSKHASNFNVFVANRVSFVQEHTAGLSWRYVPSKQNPADLVSRGTTVEELQQSIWLSGPHFLTKPTTEWPQTPHNISKTALPEQKTVKASFLVASNDILNFIYSKSEFHKVCKIIAYCRRFIAHSKVVNDRKDIPIRTLTSLEIDAAFINIVFLIQQYEFSSEINAIKHNKELPRSSNIRSLNPFLEIEHGKQILKVGGRLKNAELPYECKHPIILPKRNTFVECYVRHLHIANMHVGPQALVCILRKRFWIVSAREYARKIVNKCVHCFRYKPKMLSQIMGNLPKGRVVPAKPFTFCGVDFCGPIITTLGVRGKSKYKSYIAIFICFITRAVHMEVVSDLTSDAFIAALKRFVGRRGLCKTISLDNATNFVGARNQLKEIRNIVIAQKVSDWCLSNEIDVQHIPPRSPHFGGLWEAAVKSAKTLLYKALQSAVFTFEELSTVVVQIEGILNSRPLTPLSSDPSDEQCLTPSHFLNVSNAESIVEPSYDINKMSLLKRWQHIAAVSQHFWNRWTKEFLTSLQQRSKWDKSMPNIASGTLVMIHDDNLPPQKWLLGRVTQVFSGNDGKVRVAEIKTKAGLVKRAIVKLAALPVDESLVESS